MSEFGKLWTFEKCKNLKCDLVFWVCFVLYIDILSVSMRFNIRFCIYEHVSKYLLKRVSNISFSEVTGMQTLMFF